MSEIIDILTMLPAESPKFTVDTTGPLTVPLLKGPLGSAPFLNYFYSAGGKSVFQAGDNFTILSMGFVFPESFVMAKAAANTFQNNLSFALGLEKTTAAGPYLLPNFGVEGIQLPLENYEQPLGIFIDVEKVNAILLTVSYSLFNVMRYLDDAAPIYPAVSMIGVPAALNGTVQHVSAFVKILHNYPLT